MVTDCYIRSCELFGKQRLIYPSYGNERKLKNGPSSLAMNKVGSHLRMASLDTK
ncbi:hypothetical protein ACFO3G_03730 [Falsiporphyromonas endometrii]|uniref:Uncharacterized protein n=1 Tax=Falsiporphyromonas endometrii TaxID=1387297 RepID=A0ABV9K722_9PORP